MSKRQNGASEQANVCLGGCYAVTKKMLLAVWIGIVLCGYNTVSLAAPIAGAVWTWGYNSHGQLGNGTATGSTSRQPSPAPVADMTGVTAVAGSLGHSLAVKADGTVWAWGDNYFGQLGDGTTGSIQSTPAQVSGLTGAVAVAAGWDHSLALKTDGTVWAWGSNRYGQLGDGSGINRLTPVQVSGLTGVIAIAAGDYHNLAVKADGTVWAWGSNNLGQLGNNGTAYYELSPVQVIGLTSVTAIAGGFAHSLAVKADGTVWAWGENRYGKLGDGSGVNQPAPVQVHDIADTSGYLTGVLSVAAGEEHSLAVKTDGSVWAWGENLSGQLGDGTTISRSIPVQVSGLSSVATVAAGMGGFHSLALKSNGTMWAWGRGSYGALGDGTLIQRLTPVQVINLSEAGGVAAIAAGGDHSLAIVRPYIDLIPSALNVTLTSGNLLIQDAVKNQGTEDSTIYFSISYYLSSNTLYDAGDALLCSREVGVLAVGATDAASNTCALPPGLGNGKYFVITRVDSGNIVDEFNESNNTRTQAGSVNFNMPPVASGMAWAWGVNWDGQLGDGTNLMRSEPRPVINMTGVIAVKSGNSHSFALKADGTVWAWGDNGSGQLGNGNTTNQWTPVQVGDPLTGVIAIGGEEDADFSLALKGDGTVWAWGDNDGQLGDGTTISRSSPVQVTGLASGAIAVTAGSAHSLAIAGDSTVWAWGNNYYGQLGDGTTTRRLIPVQVKGLNNVVAITTGSNHSFAIKSDGTVWAWGANYYGQLGDGTTISRSSPVQVSGLTNVVAVAGGASHSVAIKGDGTVWAWGGNRSGELGDGSGADRQLTPVQVSGLTGVTAIAAGGNHTLAVKSDGTAWAWGDNWSGQLGDCTTIGRATPVPVRRLSEAIAIAGGQRHSLAIGNAAPGGCNTPPTANAGVDQSVLVSGLGGSAVSLDGSGSTDANGDTLTYAWSGSFGTANGMNPVVTLPPGSHTITLTVSDGQASATDSVVINVVYAFSGFLSPLTLDGRSTFHLGSVIPVKFRLTDAYGGSVTSAVARITLQQISGGEPVGSPIDGVAVGGADSGNLFRINGDTYSFNLSTRSLSAGSYLIQAVLDDGTVHSILIGLTAK